MNFKGINTIIFNHIILLRNIRTGNKFIIFFVRFFRDTILKLTVGATAPIFARVVLHGMRSVRVDLTLYRKILA